MRGIGRPDWLSYHFFYHRDRNLLLTDLVTPLVAALLSEGQIDHFFFVRYSLGGPHVRLRLRPMQGGKRGMQALRATAEAAADRFFRLCPSSVSLSQEEMERTNLSLLANDPNEQDQSVYPDNSARSFPFRPETDRYGGPELLDHSIDFFALSSVCVLVFLTSQGKDYDKRKLPFAFRFLARQALGFARDEQELLALAGYAETIWGKSTAVILDRSDEIFARQRPTFIGLLRREIETLSVPSALHREIAAAQRLAWEIRGAGTKLRRQISTSQMHMAANRLGLTNVEEVYIGRMLEQTLQALLEDDTNLASYLRARLRDIAITPPAPGESLRDLLGPTLMDLARTGSGADAGSERAVAD
jgi:hypothetical protein